MQALRAQQVTVEQRLTQLKAQRATLDTDRYYAQMEPIVVDLAQLDKRVDAREQQLAAATGAAP
jgi:iron uptake system EfeUOB component EfeO/EfeM